MLRYITINKLYLRFLLEMYQRRLDDEDSLLSEDCEDFEASAAVII